MLVFEAASPNRCVKVLGSESGPCLQRARPDLFVPAAVTAGGGVLALVLGIVLPDFTISQTEAERLADEYNKTLPRTADDASGARSENRSEPLKLQLAPVLTPNGAGLALRGTF
jgi:hypothetical protein